MTVKELKRVIDEIAENEPDIRVVVDGVEARHVDITPDSNGNLFVEIT